MNIDNPSIPDAEFVSAADLAKVIGRSPQQVSNEVSRDREFPHRIIRGKRMFHPATVLKYRQYEKRLRKTQGDAKATSNQPPVPEVTPPQASTPPGAETLKVAPGYVVDIDDLLDCSSPFSLNRWLGGTLAPLASPEALRRLADATNKALLLLLAAAEIEDGRLGIPDQATDEEWDEIFERTDEWAWHHLERCFCLRWARETFSASRQTWWRDLASPLPSDPFHGSRVGESGQLVGCAAWFERASPIEKKPKPRGKRPPALPRSSPP